MDDVSILMSRIDKRLTAMKIKKAEASRRANISQNILKNLYNKGSVPNVIALGKLAEALETTVEYLLGKTSEISPGYKEIQYDQNSAKIVGYVQAGLWGSAEDFLPEEELPDLPLPINFPYKSIKCLIVKGDSMDLHYSEDDQLLCVGIDEYDIANLVSGDHVVIKAICRADEIETTVKELHMDGNGHSWLVPKCKTKDKYPTYPLPNINNTQDLNLEINGKIIKDIYIDSVVYSSTRVNAKFR